MTSVVTGPDHRPPGRLVEGIHHVTAVLVSHDGSRWLPHVLDGLVGQHRLPDAVIAVDTGSTDDSRRLVGERLGHDRVVALPRDTGFGAAVAAGIQRTDPVPDRIDASRTWVWLLHDDSAPAPAALARLLEEVREDVAVVGPKTREWPSLRRLLEVGATISTTGQRETGLERGEPDQGQHDEVRDVLAVNTAGLLVRRDVWESLDGLEPLLPLFGDDLDLGWRVARAGLRVRVAPAAVVFHAEAASRGLRTNSISSWSPAAQARRAALVTLLANGRRRATLWQAIRLLLGGLLRTLGLLLAKAPREALDEARVLAHVYGHPHRLLAARRRRTRTATRPPEEMRRLLPNAWLPYRHGMDTVGELAVGLLRGGGARPSGRRAVVESGPVPDEAQDLPQTRSVVGKFLRHPWGLCGALLVVASLWAARGLLGEGQLAGGGLVAVPDGIGDWWRLVVASWHPVGVGSETPAAPYSLVLALAGTLTLGQPWLLVDLLVLASVPLTVWSASVLARRLFTGTLVRIAWSVSYALLPVVSGALAQGRLGTLVVALVAPLLVASAVDLLRPGSARSPWWQHAARMGWWLSLAVAFAPLAYALAGVGLLAAVLVWRRHDALATVVAALAAPWLLLGPWMWTRVSSPSDVWWEAGSADVAAGRDADPGSLVQLAAGLPGVLPDGEQWPLWIGLLPLLGAVMALGRSDRARGILLAWTVAIAGLGACAVGAGRRVDVLGSTLTAPAWTGLALVCWSAGLLTAAALAADGVEGRRSGQPRSRASLAALTAAVLVATPVLGLGWWLTGDRTGVLERGDAHAAPSYLVTRAGGPDQSATLVLDGSTEAGLQWSLLRDDGLRLGEESVLRPADELAPLDAAVTGLTSNASTDDVTVLLDHGVGAVYAPAPVDVGIALAVDSAPGLERSGTTADDARAWSIDADTGAVRAVSDPDEPLAGKAVATDGDLVGELEVPTGDTLHLATPPSSAARATAGGTELEPLTTESTTQGFRLDGASRVELHHDSTRGRWVLLQLAVMAIVVVLCLPGRRRRP